MESLKLRFVGRDRPELTLGVGMHGIGPGGGDAVGLVDESQPSLVRFCVDRRGIWLTVADGVRGVHVNGREIRRMAMLRVGDAIYVDGMEMRLVGAQPPPVPEKLPKDAGEGAETADGARILLRGVGGQYHGRSFTLERSRLVGRTDEADIRIDDPAFADRHARLELAGDRVVLRDLGSVDGSVVNGEPVRNAWLQPGDQIVFDAHHRFVIEAPALRRPEREARLAPVDEQLFDLEAPLDAGKARSPAWRLPWLLLAALVLAGLLSLLLLFGTA
nr:FHA domain-containing protein [Luteimonas aquatica]